MLYCKAYGHPTEAESKSSHTREQSLVLHGTGRNDKDVEPDSALMYPNLTPGNEYPDMQTADAKPINPKSYSSNCPSISPYVTNHSQLH